MRDCANCFHRKPVLKEDGTWTAECEKWDCEFQSRENMVEKTETTKGKWIIPNKKDFGKCSRCNVTVMLEKTIVYNYCPYCGTDMRGDTK